MARLYPVPGAVVELFKPLTWFPPMWAFGCGVVSSGRSPGESLPLLLAGALLTGPLVCATSQAVNDWFDRHVDAINEPHRPIPSGRVPGTWGLSIAVIWTLVSLLVATALGPWGIAATIVGLALAWAYSAPPIRLKRNGWWGNSAVAVCYEGLPWITGAIVMGAAMPDTRILLLAGLYSFGAHGIMTLNDFKSIAGDRQLGVGSLPARLGPGRAAWVACIAMALPQMVVVALLADWGASYHSGAVALLLAAQFVLMRRLLGDPKRHAPWYNATGTSLYVLGMLVSAHAVGHWLGSG
jgi:chlorophyll synthase